MAQDLDSREKHIFRVTGEAIVRAKPDQVLMSLGVETRDRDLLSAKEQNYQIIRKAIAKCKSMGVLDKHIQTDYIRINPNYSHGMDLVVNHYTVNQSLSIIIEDLDSYEKLLTELLQLGINQVQDIHFKLKDASDIKKEALRLAIEDAKTKAKFLSSQADMSLGKIINIGESTHIPHSMHNERLMSISNMADGGGSSDEPSLSLGMIMYKCSANLSFEIK